ncbi:MAG: pantetheine-phosphate adenylyltransferase [Arcobacteraceae bacterium]|jgi:pantetheine-phosphate adenylyltransferase|nr:pantetheine-phosphate adenylyltransferase [Arcobacteraceae bacterium]
MKKAIYCGTFDPITNGHLDIIQRALNVFDEIVLGVAESKTKNTMFDLQKRIKLAQIATQGLRVSVKPFNTLLVDFAKQENIYTIVRGLRAVSDFEYELQMGYANSSLDSKIDTVYFMPTLQNAFVSSTVVREVLRFGGDVSHLVPQKVLECI